MGKIRALIVGSAILATNHEHRQPGRIPEGTRYRKETLAWVSLETGITKRVDCFKDSGKGVLLSILIFMNQIQIEYKKITELKPAAYNPRKIADREMEKLMRSLEQYGCVEPVVINQDDTIIGGHQRVAAAKRLGIEEVPVIKVDIPKEKEKALNLALNRIQGEWDEALLVALLKEMGEEERSLSGFDPSEIAKILKKAIEGEEDDFNGEPPAEPKSKRGDLYRLGEHTLICGDAVDEADVKRLMADDRAAMVFTDPPYNVDYGNHDNPRWGKDRKIVNDKMSDGDWQVFVDGFIKSILQFNAGAAYICMSCKEWGPLQSAWLRLGGHWSTTIIWAKDRFTLGRADYQRQYEPILYGWKEGAEHYWCGDRDQGDVWQLKRPSVNDLHPTMKPIQLVVKALNGSSVPGDIVLDLFGGSGTTLIACEQAGRKCRMMEIDPGYCDVIIARWEKYTGKKAEIIT